MIIALTGAGISASSGIPTFQEQPGIRRRLTRSFANKHPAAYLETIQEMEVACRKAEPNDAHYALAEYHVPVITMNVDELHQRAGSAFVLPIHGSLPDIVLYDDPAPLYPTAFEWVLRLGDYDTLLVIGTSYFTAIAVELKKLAERNGARVMEITDDAEHKVRAFLESNHISKNSDQVFFSRQNRKDSFRSGTYIDEKNTPL